VTTNDGKEIGYIWVRITTADTWNGWFSSSCKNMFDCAPRDQNVTDLNQASSYVSKLIH
jgi:hypothetical protein